MRILPRLLCLLNGHDWPDWPAWTRFGDNRFRGRECRLCNALDFETDR